MANGQWNLSTRRVHVAMGVGDLEGEGQRASQPRAHCLVSGSVRVGGIDRVPYFCSSCVCACVYVCLSRVVRSILFYSQSVE